MLVERNYETASRKSDLIVKALDGITLVVREKRKKEGKKQMDSSEQ